MASSSDLYKQIEKIYGKDIIRKGSTVLEQKKNIIKISPAFDASLGGIPEGSWVTLSGHSGCGKTTLALTIAAEAQQAGMKVVYLNAEGRIKPMNFNGIPGLNAEEIDLIGSTEERLLTAEDYLSLGTQILKSQKRVVMILDSASSLCSATEAAEDVRGNGRSANPRTLGSFCRKNGELVQVMDSIVVIIKHLITNTSGYGLPFNEDGGVKIQYQADIRLMAKKNPVKWFEGGKEEGKQIGQVIEWEVIKSALGSPGHPFQNYLRYGKGIDKAAECAVLAEDYGLIDKAGAWYSFDYNGSTQKFQGKEKLITYLQEQVDVREHFQKQINEISGFGQ